MTRSTVVIYLLIGLIVTVGVVYVVRQPAKVSTECTAEYVQQFGSTDCQNSYKQDEALQEEQNNNLYN